MRLTIERLDNGVVRGSSWTKCIGYICVYAVSMSIDAAVAELRVYHFDRRVPCAC